MRDTRICNPLVRALVLAVRIGAKPDGEPPRPAERTGATRSGLFALPAVQLNVTIWEGSTSGSLSEVAAMRIREGRVT